MSSNKTERLLNLLIMLLVQRHYVGKDRIREILYPDSSPDGFEKMFERDKEELRSLGVPIEVGALDVMFDDAVGYRIRPDDFALPEIDLAADEAAVIGLAARVWDHARLAEVTTDAVRKLTALGMPIDTGQLEIAEPRLNADEPSFETFWEATQERSVIEFDYQRLGGEPSRRHLEPWGVLRYSGRWYVAGRDIDRDAERVFRLSRVVGEARTIGAPNAYSVPDNVDLREIARRLEPNTPPVEARVLMRHGRGAGLRRRATVTAIDVLGPDQSHGWDRLSLVGTGLIDELLSLGPDVVVEGPAEVRNEVIARLRGVVES